jgi:pyruvate kinase
MATLDTVARRTKIVATIGPGSSSHEMVRALAQAGMDAVRLNFSHGMHEEHATRAGITRAVQAELGRPLALIADLQGPKLRVGTLTEPRLLVAGETVVIAGADRAQEGDLVVAPAVIGEVLQPGHDVLIDDGLLRLLVEESEGGRARCRVVVGGVVKSSKGVNLPGVPVPVPSLTEKDLDDLDFALALGVDYVALSFVRAASDVSELKAIIAARGSTARVIAKIEKSEAIDVLDDVVAAADAVMVARGDLGVEIGAATVPLLQKRIILRCLEAGKPVITATQMLESMVEHAEPTRAEASDVANAILDGTSAVMLSAETAIGAYPVEAIRTMDNIARAVEPSMDYRHQLPEASSETDVRRAMSNAATDLAETLGVKAIVVATATGRTASEIARLRPRRAMVGLSHHQAAVQQMALEWGVLPLLMPSTADVEDLWIRTIETARDAGLVDSGDLVVLIAGTAVNRSGSTNVIKVDIA